MDSRIQDLLESELKDQEYPDFDPGDTICVRTREEIGGQMRNREFEGVCIGRSGKGPDQTFKVRKDSFGVGVERIFPLYSPMIEEIEIIRKGKVRQAKLNYLENRSQKDARIEEERVDLDELNRVEDEQEGAESTEDESDEDQETTEADEETATEETPEEDLEAPSETDESEETDEGEDTTESPESEADESTDAEDSGDPDADSNDDTEETDPSDEKKEEVGESV